MWGENNGRFGNGTLDNSTIPINIGCPQSLDVDNLTEYMLISTYPNPVKDKFFISNSSLNLIENVTVYDLFANKVLEVNNNPTEIALNGLASGIYVVRIASLGKYHTFKIVKL